MSLRGKVAIMPCTGVGQVVGTIARQAAYRVCEDERPRETVLLYLPALVRGVQEDLDMVAQCSVVVIEGCRQCCAAHALASSDGSPAAAVLVPEVMRGKGLKIRREARRQLSEGELAAVELVVARVVSAVDRLLRRDADAQR